MEDNRMTHIEDTEVLGEIDDVNYFGFETAIVNDDPFAKVNFENLSPKMKRKAQRLAKKFEGIDGVSTKYIDPEMLADTDLQKHTHWRQKYRQQDLDQFTHLFCPLGLRAGFAQVY